MTIVSFHFVLKLGNNRYPDDHKNKKDGSDNHRSHLRRYFIVVSVQFHILVFLYDYFCNLQTVPARDVDFGDCVTVNLYDGDGNVADEFRISGSYVQRMGMEGTYEIVEEGYSYEDLRESLRQISEEGQE